MDKFINILESMCATRRLDGAQAAQAFDLIMSGEVDSHQIAGFLTALRTIGETPEVIAAGARSLRARLVPVSAPGNAIDTCGTGGDSKGSFNISTASAIIAAGAGVPVAKHGNKALSSKSGSAEVLEMLGVKLDIPSAKIEQCLTHANIGFMFAPAHHNAMRHAAPARSSLKLRTVFNLLGPLSNPAGAKRQLLGVFDGKWTEPMAKTLQQLGSEHAWVVHGQDGMDELTTTSASRVSELKAGQIRTFNLDPQELGLPLANEADLKGGGPRENADAILALLNGAPGAFRDICILNSAAAILVSGKVDNLQDGMARAMQAIDTGHAKAALQDFAQVSNS